MSSSAPRIIIATPPAFLNQQDAGHYLGHSEEWLRVNAKRHDLYKPSNGISRQGCASKYHLDHLNVIARHLLSPDTFTEDMALQAWRRIKINSIQDIIEAAKAPRRKGSK